MTSTKEQKGVIDPISIIAGLFLVVTLVVGTGVVSNRQNNLSIEKEASSCYDECRKESGSRVCDCRCNGICTRDDYQTDRDSPDNPVVTPAGSSNVPTVNVSKNRCEQGAGFWCEGCGGFCLSGSYTGGGCNQAQKAKCGENPQIPNIVCNAKNEGRVVVLSSGDDKYRKCVKGEWTDNCGGKVYRKCKIEDLKEKDVPTYLKKDYNKAIQKQEEENQNNQQQDTNENNNSNDSMFCNVAIKESFCGTGGDCPNGKYCQIWTKNNCDEQIVVTNNSCNISDTGAVVVDTKECEVGAKGCDGNTLLTCSQNGFWISQNCEHGCSNNSCVVKTAITITDLPNEINITQQGQPNNQPNPTQTANQLVQDAAQIFSGQILDQLPIFNNYNNNLRNYPPATQTSTTQAFGFWHFFMSLFSNSGQPELPDDFSPLLSANSMAGGQYTQIPTSICSGKTGQDYQNCINGVLEGTKDANNVAIAMAGIVYAAPVAYSYAPQVLIPLMNIKYVPQILTAADAVDSTLTGAACAVGNQEACSYFAASVAIPGFTSQNMLIDTFDDFLTAWKAPLSSLDDLVTFSGSVMRLDGNDIGGWPINQLDNVNPNNTNTLVDMIPETGGDMNISNLADTADNFINPPSSNTNSVNTANDLANALAPDITPPQTIANVLDQAAPPANAIPDVPNVPDVPKAPDVPPLTSIADNTPINVTDEFAALPINNQPAPADVPVIAGSGVNISTSFTDPSSLDLKQQYKIAIDSIPGYRNDTNSLSDLTQVKKAYSDAGMTNADMTAVESAINSQWWPEFMPTKETFYAIFYGSTFDTPFLPKTATGPDPKTKPKKGILATVRNWWDETFFNPSNWFAGSPSTNPFASETSTVISDPLTGGITKNPLPENEIPIRQNGRLGGYENYQEYLDFNFNAPASYYEEFGGQASIPKLINRNGQGGYTVETVKGIKLEDFKGKLTQAEIDIAIKKLAEQQTLTGYAHGDITNSNVLIETLPDKSHEVNFIDYRGKLDEYKSEKWKQTSISDLRDELSKYAADNTDSSGQALLEFSLAIPATIVLPVAGLYVVDQYFDLGITDYLINTIKDALSDNSAAKSVSSMVNSGYLPILEPLAPILPTNNSNFEEISNDIATNNQIINEIKPEGLTTNKSNESGKCQRIDRSNPCDGERIYELYLWYRNQDNAWWNEDGDLTPADFLALMLLAEAKGADAEFLKAIMTASSNQLWGQSNPAAPNGDKYCTTTDCSAGIFNFIGAYMEAGARRYNSIIFDNLSSDEAMNSLLSDQSNADIFASYGLTIDQIAKDTVHSPTSTVYDNDTPTQWGNFGCGKECDDLGPNWIKEANQVEIKTGTTDRCGLYNVVGQEGGLAVVFTNNQRYNWSNKTPECFDK